MKACLFTKPMLCHENTLNYSMEYQQNEKSTQTLEFIMSWLYEFSICFHICILFWSCNKSILYLVLLFATIQHLNVCFYRSNDLFFVHKTLCAFPLSCTVLNSHITFQLCQCLTFLILMEPLLVQQRIYIYLLLCLIFTPHTPICVIHVLLCVQNKTILAKIIFSVVLLYYK